MNILPTMPQFRERNGRIDWRQVADVFLPGDVWNSRTNQWRPQGMVAGVADQLVPFGGLAVEALYANRDRFGMPQMPQFRNPFRGVGDWLGFRTGRVTEDRGFLGPSARNPMMPSGSARVPDFASQDNWGTREGSGTGPFAGWRMPGVMDARGGFYASGRAHGTPWGAGVVSGDAAREMFASMRTPEGTRQVHNYEN